MEIQAITMITFIVGTIGLIVLPLGGIWAMNTLFHTGIEYTLANWVSVVFLQLYFQLMIKAGHTKTSKEEK